MRKKIFFSNFLDETLINLTPLIDVVFVVLIAFIVVAPLLKKEEVDLYKKENSKKSFFKKDSLSIYVKRDNSIFINGQKIEKKDLFSYLKKEKGSSKRISLFHDRNATFGTYQMIKETAEKAGYDRLDLVLKR